MNVTRNLPALLAGLALTITVSIARAEISGKVDLFCESSDVVGCTETLCLQGTPGSFDLSHYMLIDVESKAVRGLNQEGESFSSPVLNTDVTDKAFILQGIDDHRGWTMGIDRGTGKMTVSSTSADVNFMITGTCTER